MGKKKKRYEDQKKISEFLYDDYIYNRDLKSPDAITNSIELLVSNGIACKISGSTDVSYIVNKYFVASKFMIDNNESLKKYRRPLLKYEAAGSEGRLANINDELIKLGAYGLDDGTYYAYLGNKNHDNYAVLVISHPEASDQYMISYTLYIIGDKFLKYKKKFDDLYEHYNKLLDSVRNEYIMYTDGRPQKEVQFKGFDKLVLHDKEKILKYIDNWKNNIPNYYQYGMTPKLSILLHGDPGCGKSSFTKALAKYLNISNVLNISPSYFSDEVSSNNGRRFHLSPYNPTIVSIDDIDCVCRSREDDKSVENNQIMSSLLEYLDNPHTFLLTANDGKKYNVSVVVATTNYLDKLDDAVKRYGRFDLRLEMKYFQKEEAQEMCDIYGLKLKDIYKGKIDNDFTISPAQLQALCLENIDEGLKNQNVKKDGSRNGKEQKAEKTRKGKH